MASIRQLLSLIDLSLVIYITFLVSVAPPPPCVVLYLILWDYSQRGVGLTVATTE